MWLVRQAAVSMFLVEAWTWTEQSGLVVILVSAFFLLAGPG